MPGSIFGLLLRRYGRRGWWPLLSRAGRGGYDPHGYHPGSYDPPESAADRFEIAIGAVLTQNTSWTNVEKALSALRAAGVFLPRHVLDSDPERLASTIRPSGYYNVKARKLREVAAFMLAEPRPDRAGLLRVWGIGPETADSIMLYAYGSPVFVVDAYTKRVFGRLGIIDPAAPYDDVAEALSGRAAERRAEIFNERHALIVEHAKRHCRTKPLCANCPLSSHCPSREDP